MKIFALWRGLQWLATRSTGRHQRIGKSIGDLRPEISDQLTNDIPSPVCRIVLGFEPLQGRVALIQIYLARARGLLEGSTRDDLHPRNGA